jgi:hypothetical protein
MAKKSGVKPEIAGGRTLARMRRGKGQDGGGKKHGRKAIWFQGFPFSETREGTGTKYEMRGKQGAHLEGAHFNDIPTGISNR